MSEYDAIIIGAGAGGGIVAGVLAEAGKTVLLLERGRNLSFDEVSRDHLRNQRLSLYGVNAGPEIDGHPRVYEAADGRSFLQRPHDWSYQNNAACVGGGTRVYGGMAWRFMPEDFRMASVYGVPEGSSLADWPIGYDDLEPYYERAEWEIGVAGLSGADKFAAPRRREYPLPPSWPNPERAVLERGAAALGLNTFPAPLLINTIAYNGRPACGRCGMCVGFACPTDGKNGTQNTLVKRAMATGRCTLITQAMVERIHTDAANRATGVSFFVNGKKETATAKIVVSSAGAIESARLLLNSRNDDHPNGLGNDFDLVGRNLQGHVYAGAWGLMPEPIYDGLGPGVSIATTQFNHHNPGIIGGGLLCNDFIRLPAIFMKWMLPPGLPRWGIEAKKHMRENYRRTIQVTGPIHETPSASSRVTIDPYVRDQYGIPVVRVSGATHPESIVAADFLRHRAEEWLGASGANRVWSWPNRIGISAGQHQAGTCRMGTDVKSSVTDSYGRVHGHENLFVVDSSTHVTNGGFNPVLTIMALAFRSAQHIAHHC